MFSIVLWDTRQTYMSYEKHSVFHAALSKKGMLLDENYGFKRERFNESFYFYAKDCAKKISNRKNVLRGRGLNKIKRI